MVRRRPQSRTGHSSWILARRPSMGVLPGPYGRLADRAFKLDSGSTSEYGRSARPLREAREAPRWAIDYGLALVQQSRQTSCWGMTRWMRLV